MSWQIKGETGATLNGTLRELHTINIQSASLKFGSLENDELTWTAKTEDATGAGTIVPDNGQKVELWKDGVRKFLGYVISPRIGSKQITIKAVGPWWWMTRIPLTDDQTDESGTVADRVNYVFPSGSHKTKIETLLNRAITQGVPMRLGTVDATYDTPNMSMAEKNCAQAIAELMAWLPDAVMWFDYSDTSGNGLPIVNVTRRGNMAAQNYAIGVDAVIDAEITPRLDLEVAYSRLDYVVRSATTGKPQWAVQSAGTSVTGKRQIVTVSGPEIVDSLPNEDFDYYWIATHTTTTGYIQTADTEAVAHIAKYPTDLISGNSLNSGSGVAYAVAGGNYGTNYSTGAIVYPSGYVGVSFGWSGNLSPSETAIHELNLRKVVLEGRISGQSVQIGSPTNAQVEQRQRFNDIVSGDVYWFSGGNYFAARKYAKEAWIMPSNQTLFPAANQVVVAGSGTADYIILGSEASTFSGAYVGAVVSWLYRFSSSSNWTFKSKVLAYDPATRQLWFDRNNYTLNGNVYTTPSPAAVGEQVRSNATFYNAPTFRVSAYQYDFFTPPAGLAAGLQAAQNWVPWEGPISLIADEVSGDNTLNKKYNLSNALTPCATMATLARSVSHDIMGGRTTIDLGAPARSDFGTLTSRIRRQPRDNIVYL